MLVNAVPYDHAVPYLAVKDASAAIAFYQKAFGATETIRLADPQGKIAHAEIKIDNATIMLADEYPGFSPSPLALGGSPVTIHLYVEDVDWFVQRAVAAGAKLLIAVSDQFYGDRSGRLEDPFGHVWMIATHQEDVSVEEMRRRFGEYLKQQGG